MHTGMSMWVCVARVCGRACVGGITRYHYLLGKNRSAWKGIKNDLQNTYIDLQITETGLAGRQKMAER